MPERGGVHPRLERLFVPPPRHHQPGGTPVGRLQQLEALETVLVVHRAGPGREPAGQLVAAISRHGNRVDPHDRHAYDHARTADLRRPDGTARAASTQTGIVDLSPETSVACADGLRWNGPRWSL